MVSSNEGSGENAHLRILASASSDRICNNCQQLPKAPRLAHQWNQTKTRFYQIDTVSALLMCFHNMSVSYHNSIFTKVHVFLLLKLHLSLPFR